MPSTISAPNSFGKRQFRRPGPLAACCLAALIVIFAWRCYRTYRVFNDTADEAVHISCGLEVWQHGRYTIEPQHPPLARMILALPAYRGGLRLVDERPLWSGSRPEFYWRTLSLARLGNLVFVPFLLVWVFLWGRRLYGTAAGLGAAALVSFSPNLLAHASLATLDFGAATTALISSFHFWRWSQQGGVRHGLWAAVAFGVAVLTKFSALFLLPGIAIAFFLLARRDERPGPAWQAVALFPAVVALVVWSGYRFEIGPLPPAQFLPPPGSFAHNLQQATQNLLNQTILPAPRFLRGIVDVLSHNAQGHHSYLLGRLGQHGWWYYFPVVLAVKTTLPLLLLAAIAVLFKRRGDRKTLYLLSPVAVLLAVCMSSNLNLGVRHILAIYPFLALLASGLFVCSRRPLVAAALGLTLWHGVESIVAHPDYLAYFNQTVRGREEEFLLDSNLDWGQDLERLRRYLEENDITTVYLSYFGRADPARLGIRGIRPLPPDLRPAGWVAVSRAHIAGLALAGYDLAWLKAYTPAAVIGKSILVYYFPE